MSLDESGQTRVYISQGVNQKRCMDLKQFHRGWIWTTKLEQKYFLTRHL